ncbi:hypothetical protein EJB05_38636, partial [Eragrostis curvula]
MVSPRPTPQGDVCRGRPRRIQEECEDRLSGLPEELLLDVLNRLGCVREAARTSALSRRWCNLWAELRELKFHDVRPNMLENALSQVRPKLKCLDIKVRLPEDRNRLAVARNHGARISSLLCAADRLQPVEFVFSLDRYRGSRVPVPLEVPCFERTASIHLLISRINCTLTPVGELTSLKQLTIKLGSCPANPSFLISRCPSLRKLTMDLNIMRTNNTFAIESESLEELTFSMRSRNDTVAIVIVAPELKHFIMKSEHCELAMSQSVPKLEDVLLEYTFAYPRVGFGKRWPLQSLRMATEWSDMHPTGVRVHVLTLRIYPHHDLITSEQSIAQEIARLPVTSFSVLKLHLQAGGHVFGALLLQLLRIRTSIRKLKLFLWETFPRKRMFQECSEHCDCKCYENCDCYQDPSWRNENLSLPDLEDVEIQGFGVVDDTVDVLKLLFRSAPMLKTMNIQVSDELTLNNGGQQRLENIFQANASVKCSIRVSIYYEGNSY